MRSSGGWQITETGRAFLIESEVLISALPQEVIEARTLAAALPPAPLVGSGTRRRIWWSRRRPEKKTARSSVA